MRSPGPPTRHTKSTTGTNAPTRGRVRPPRPLALRFRDPGDGDFSTARTTRETPHERNERSRTSGSHALRRRCARGVGRGGGARGAAGPVFGRVAAEARVGAAARDGQCAVRGAEEVGKGRSNVPTIQ